MRQEISSEQKITQLLNISQSLIEKGWVKVEKKLINPLMLDWYKKSLITQMLNCTIAYYTLGSDKLIIKENLRKVIYYMNTAWKTGVTNLSVKDKLYEQYTLSNYDEMLWMISLGYLLDIDEEEFKKLVSIIDRDAVKDYLLEFIIRAKIKDREQIIEESYSKFFGIPKTFDKLRRAIKEEDKTNAQKLIEDFILKDWYKNHKDAGWYDSHKSSHDTYFGYWSFETAAVVKIMGLDDSSFKEALYYPHDLTSF